MTLDFKYFSRLISAMLSQTTRRSKATNQIVQPHEKKADVDWRHLPWGGSCGAAVVALLRFLEVEFCGGTVVPHRGRPNSTIVLAHTCRGAGPILLFPQRPSL